ncbi:MAG: rRNA biogenesis protein rrp5 [Clostridia bacterium]
MSKTKMALDVVQDLRSLADSVEALAKALDASDGAIDELERSPEQPVSMTTTPPETAITLVALRAFVAERSTPENRPKIKEILTRYGVKKLTELTEDKYAAVMREVAAL